MIIATRNRLIHVYRTPDDTLVGELHQLGMGNVQAIGDAWNPGTIAEAVFSGRLYAEALQAEPADRGDTPFRREVIRLA